MNTKCKYNKGRSVLVGITDGFLYTPGVFNLILLQQGYLSLQSDNNRIFINGPSLLCLSGNESVTLGMAKGTILSLSFAPQFINVHLNYKLIGADEYLQIAKKHLFPTFEIFTKRSASYGGVIPLSEVSTARMFELFIRIKILITQQPTVKWSCKTRSEMFLIFDLAEFNLNILENNNNEISGLLESIHAQIDTNLSLINLFKLHNTTAPTVSRKFKKEFGMTAINYVLSLRLSLCSYVLAFTDINVNEIAENYEFNDSTYFARMFKRQFGYTPCDFRIFKRTDSDNLLK